MVVKFTVAFRSSRYTLYSSGLQRRKALSLINLVLGVLNNSVSQKCLQGLFSMQSTPFLKDQMMCSTFSRQRTQEKKSPDAAAQTVMKFYLSPTLV